ncbi:hypothetical protein PMAYCL1PPCAC_03523, partial [Pristionchus mayeri]
RKAVFVAFFSTETSSIPSKKRKEREAGRRPSPILETDRESSTAVPVSSDSFGSIDRRRLPLHFELLHVLLHEQFGSSETRPNI